MQRTNKETVKAHIHLMLGHLLGDWEGNQKVINSLRYALKAVDAYNPQKTPLQKRVFALKKKEKVEK